MFALCHRCHAQLPPVGSDPGHPEEGAALFCPRCGAPQILLPHHMRVEVVPVETSPAAVPEPHAATLPGQVDWRAAITAIALVAAVGAVLAVAGLAFDAVSFLSMVWTMGGAAIALTLYVRSRPRAWVDGRVGFRIGVATGLISSGAIGFALAATGVVLRFGTHGLSGFDADLGQAFASVHLQMQQMADKLHDQGQSIDAQMKLMDVVGSPEGHAGATLFYFAFIAGFILLLSAGGGAFAGMLRGSRAARAGLRRGE